MVPSIGRVKLLWALVSDLDTMRIISVLLELSWRKCICSQDSISEMQVVRVI